MYRLATAGVAAALALTVAALPASAQSSAPNAARHGCDTGASDFDGNGGVDLALTAPYGGGNEDGDYVPGTVGVLMQHQDGRKLVYVPKPNKFQGYTVHDFGTAIAELDLSDHQRASEPCADLAVSADYGPYDYSRDVIFLFRWSKSASKFHRFAAIDSNDLAFGIDGFGGSLASQTMATDRPAPREHVLYTSASEDGVGCVVRLILSAQGTVLSRQLIEPGGNATRNVPIDGHTANGSFGRQLLGTPDPEQVIISAPEATTGDGGGAVIVWNDRRKSQLITPRKLQLPGPKGNYAGSRKTEFGLATFLTTEASNASGDDTALMIGLPHYSFSDAYHGGAAVQLRYDRSTDPAKVVLSHRKWWSQNSKGVGGKPDDSDRFGAAFQTLTTGRHPVILATAQGERDKRSAGVVDALGTGQVFRATSVGEKPRRENGQFGGNLSSVHEIRDRLAHDPFPPASKGKWARGVVVTAPYDYYLAVGLPTHKSPHYKTYKLPVICSYEGQSCEWGADMSSSLGG